MVVMLWKKIGVGQNGLDKAWRIGVKRVTCLVVSLSGRVVFVDGFFLLEISGSVEFSSVSMVRDFEGDNG